MVATMVATNPSKPLWVQLAAIAILVLSSADVYFGMKYPDAVYFITFISQSLTMAMAYLGFTTFRTNGGGNPPSSS